MSQTHASDPGTAILCRDREIEKIQTLIFQEREKRIVLPGFSGVGKSMVARKLYHTVKDRCTHIAWIEYQDSLKDSILRMFIDLEIPDEEKRWTRIQSLLGEMREDTLLFIDGINGISRQDRELLEEIGATLILTLKTKVDDFISDKDIYSKVRMGLLIAEPFLRKYENEERSNYASFCHNIAGVYSRQGAYERALEWCQRALPILERSLGTNHPNTCVVRENLEMCKKKPTKNDTRLFFLGKCKNPGRSEPSGFLFGADNGTRTHDLLITNQLLYQLS